MADVVTMVRGRGYIGGWVPMVFRGDLHPVRAEAILDGFHRGEGVRRLARRWRVPVSVIEDVLRWDFRRPRRG